jgi:ATP-dependent RNA helicase SUPV3L1/SUV3
VAETAAVTLDQPVMPASLSGAAKGIAYIVFERLGSVPTFDVAHLARNMHESDKPILARLGLRFGVETVYMPEMLKPAQISLRGLLWSLHEEAFFDGAPPPAGRVAIDAIADVPDLYWLAIGYRRLGQRVMRVDMVERVAMLVRTAAREGQFKITEDMLSLAGATREAMGLMLLDLGCRVVGEETAEDPTKPAIQIFEKQKKPRVTQNRRQANNASRSGDAESRAGTGKSNRRPKAKAASSGPRGTHKASSKHAAKPNPDSPFAVLAGLKLKK